MNDANENAGRQKVFELIGGIDYAFFVTSDKDGAPFHARPMAYRKMDDDGDLWFFSKKDSRKADEVRAQAQVVVTFADPRTQVFVSISGRAEMVAERSKIEALWSEIYRAWFPGGFEDENVILIRVRATHAEYCDTPTSKMVFAFGYMRAALTGKPMRAGDVGSVDMA